MRTQVLSHQRRAWVRDLQTTHPALPADAARVREKLEHLEAELTAARDTVAASYDRVTAIRDERDRAAYCLARLRDAPVKQSRSTFSIPFPGARVETITPGSVALTDEENRV